MVGGASIVVRFVVCWVEWGEGWSGNSKCQCGSNESRLERECCSHSTLPRVDLNRTTGDLLEVNIEALNVGNKVTGLRALLPPLPPPDQEVETSAEPAAAPAAVEEVKPAEEVAVAPAEEVAVEEVAQITEAADPIQVTILSTLPSALPSALT